MVEKALKQLWLEGYPRTPGRESSQCLRWGEGLLAEALITHWVRGSNEAGVMEMSPAIVKMVPASEYTKSH